MSAQPPVPPLRILVVENDVDTRTFFKLYLEHLGHHVDAATGVTDALTVISQSRYDVMFVDIGLADGTGWELMDILRERSLPAPAYAVAMTGYGMSEDRAHSEAAGFRRHLLKPFASAEIKAVLEEAREVVGAH